ncbi:MAG TPA: NusG domain II-containing protein [Synergistaceae bacterium]|nr:NusG domain II-containing protein [Synergistaceae bacterium]
MGMKRGDRAMLGILMVILVASGVVWGTRSMTAAPDAMTAEIIQDGKLLQRVSLKKGDPAREFAIEYKGGRNRLKAEDGKIAVIEADCPDKDCVKRGWLKRPGDSAICLPHRLVIRLTGESEVDGVTW